MLCYKENYGSDADGNRGVTVVECEIEASDKDEVIEKLYDLFLEGETGTQTISMYCCITDEDIDIEVEIEDYIDGLIEKADEDEDIKDDEDIQEMIEDLKLDLLIEKAEKLNRKKAGVK